MTEGESSKIKQQVEKLHAWLKTPRGKRAIERAMKANSEKIKKLEEATAFDPRSHHQPMTI